MNKEIKWQRFTDWEEFKDQVINCSYTLIKNYNFYFTYNQYKIGNNVLNLLKKKDKEKHKFTYYYNTSVNTYYFVIFKKDKIEVKYCKVEKPWYFGTQTIKELRKKLKLPKREVYIVVKESKINNILKNSVKNTAKLYE